MYVPECFEANLLMQKIPVLRCCGPQWLARFLFWTLNDSASHNTMENNNVIVDTSLNKQSYNDHALWNSISSYSVKIKKLWIVIMCLNCVLAFTRVLSVSLSLNLDILWCYYQDICRPTPTETDTVLMLYNGTGVQCWVLYGCTVMSLYSSKI